MVKSGGLWMGGGAAGGLWTPGGGGSPSCGYVGPVNPTSPSSLTIYGEYLTPQGVWIAATPPPSAIVATSGPISVYGTPNAGFGVNTGVLPPTTIEATWQFDTTGAGGVPWVCYAGLYGPGFNNTTIEYYDGAAWQVVTPGAQSPYLRSSAWRVHFGPITLGGGYFSGEDYAGLGLWAGNPG